MFLIYKNVLGKNYSYSNDVGAYQVKVTQINKSMLFPVAYW